MNPTYPYTHPEIEFRHAELVKNGPIIDSDGSTGINTFVDLLEIYPDRTEWKPNLNHSSLVDLIPLDETGKCTKPQPLRMIFLDNLFFLSDHADNQYPWTETDSTGHWMRQLCGLSPIFMSVATRKHGGIRGNGYFIRRDEDGKAIALDGFYHYSAGKNLSTSVWFSHGLARDENPVYIVHKCPEGAKENILACAQVKASFLLRPLAIDAFLAEHTLRQWEIQWETCISELGHYEWQPKSGMTPIQTTRATESLHNLSQRMYSLQAHLNDFQDVMGHLAAIRHRLAFFISDRLEHEEDHRNVDDMVDSVAESMYFLQSRSDFIKRWVSIHRERVGIQINLFFNLANQLDSRTNLDIAKLTSKISVSTQRDSSSMITIAIMTMFFLPATFVSAFFSMVFFDTKPDSNGQPTLLIGSQLWIYFVATVALTVLIFGIWSLWQYHRTSRQSRQFDVENLATLSTSVNATNVQLSLKEKPD